MMVRKLQLALLYTIFRFKCRQNICWLSCLLILLQFRLFSFYLNAGLHKFPREHDDVVVEPNLHSAVEVLISNFFGLFAIWQKFLCFLNYFHANVERIFSNKLLYTPFKSLHINSWWSLPITFNAHSCFVNHIKDQSIYRRSPLLNPILSSIPPYFTSFKQAHFNTILIYLEQNKLGLCFKDQRKHISKDLW
jgi:hypothetical protein